MSNIPATRPAGDAQSTAPPAVTEHDVRRAIALMRRIAANPYIAAQPTLKQTAFLLAAEREVLLTGSGGCGKTVGLLASALLDMDRPGYRALLVHRTLGRASDAPGAGPGVAGADRRGLGHRWPRLAFPLGRVARLRPRAVPVSASS